MIAKAHPKFQIPCSPPFQCLAIGGLCCTHLSTLPWPYKNAGSAFQNHRCAETYKETQGIGLANCSFTNSFHPLYMFSWHQVGQLLIQWCHPLHPLSLSSSLVFILAIGGPWPFRTFYHFSDTNPNPASYCLRHSFPNLQPIQGRCPGMMLTGSFSCLSSRHHSPPPGPNKCLASAAFAKQLGLRCGVRHTAPPPGFRWAIS